MNIDRAYIFGIYVGDGYSNKNSIGLNVKDLDFALNFKYIFEKEFDMKGKVYNYDLNRVEFHNRKLVKYFKNFDIYSILKCSTPIKCAFLKGFYDSEGSVSLKIVRGIGRCNRKIELSNTNLKLLKFCKQLLEQSGISARKIDKRIRGIRTIKGKILKPCIYYRFNLSEKKENFEKFSSLVGFSIKRKQDKLNQLVGSYLPTRYKWPKEREQVLKLKDNERYTNIIKKFSYISPNSIQNWLYHEKK